MRIGTLTYHKADNYGAILQAFALQKFLLELGCETEIINYLPNSPVSKKNKANVNRYLAYLIKPIDYIRAKIKHAKFENFRKKHLLISEQRWHGDSEISRRPPNYDIYIVGSDQIWNTDISNSSEAFFLHFNQSKKKAAYAASIGKAEPNDIERIFFLEHLKHFSAISVREDSLRKTLEDQFKIKAELVLDPVFLLDKCFWEKISLKVSLPSKYVLCYLMEFSEVLIRHTYQIAEKYKLSPIFISPSGTYFRGKKLKMLGPTEFIYSLYNAQYICTNSFHGTAFSIIFNKNFAIAKHTRLNSRISSLINLVNLEDKYLDSNYFNTEEVDYVQVMNKLEPLIFRSKLFLRNLIATP